MFISKRRYQCEIAKAANEACEKMRERENHRREQDEIWASMRDLRERINRLERKNKLTDDNETVTPTRICF